MLATFKSPWVVEGDFNVTPQELEGSGWLRMVGGVLCAPVLPTCNDHTYDFFIVHRSLAHAVVGAERLDDVGVHPHRASRLLLRGDARRCMTRQ